MSDHDDKMRTDSGYRRAWESLEYREPHEMRHPSDSPPFNRSCFVWLLGYAVIVAMIIAAAVWALS